jgi:DNA primase catalytic subunit
MKLTALNDLSDAVLNHARSFDRDANMRATMYARSDNPDDKASFQMYDAKAATIREVHALMCQHLHYLESLLTKDEIAKLNKIEEDKKNSK